MAQSTRKEISEKKVGVEMSDFSSAPLPSTLQPTYVPPDSAVLLSTPYPSITPTEEKKKEKTKEKEKKLQLEKKVVSEIPSAVKTEIKEQKLKEPPIAQDAVITQSTLMDRDSDKQAEKIKSKFNEGRPLKPDGTPESCFSTSDGGRGEYLERDQFLLGSRNKTPELASFVRDKNITMAVKAPTTLIERHGLYKHYDLFFGINGAFVLNVPPDKFAKAWFGQKPKLYGPGPHVIKDSNFKFEPQTGLVSQSTPIISHGNLQVIRVPKGSIAKIWIGTEPYILQYREELYVFDSPLFRIEKNGQQDFFSASDAVISHGPISIMRIPARSYAKAWEGTKPLLLWAREEPYVFDSPLFRIEKNGGADFFNVSDAVISHGPITILRIPAGSYAKVWDGATPLLLSSRDEPYAFDSAQFRLERNGEKPFFDAAAEVIQHGTISIIRVPAGYIAKVWEGSKPRLLEAQDEPYYFDSAVFRIEKTGDRYFVSATEKLIEHGSIKRILPPINHEAIVSDGGNLVIIKPSKDGSPIVLDSSSQKFDGFIDKTVQTVTFPSKKTIEQRLKDKKDHPTYEIFRTKDSLEVGVTLLVGYQITDPKKAIETLGMDGIESHIEHLANVDMSKAVQQSSSQEFLSFYQTKPHRDEPMPGSYGQQTVPPPQHYQDIVKKQLADDLRTIGIDIIRLNIENPTIINKVIAAKREEQSMLAAEADAKEAVLKQNYNIDLGKAQREADIKKVAQDQVNQALLSAAQAKLDAARIEAEARLVAARAEAESKVIAAKAAADAEANAKVVAADADSKAKAVATDAESKAILMKAEAEVKAIVMRAEAEAKASLMKAEAEAKALEHPELRQMRELKVKMDAVQNLKLLPPSAGTLPPGMAVTPFGLFSQFSADSAPTAVVEQRAAPSLLQVKVED